jgi:hypothetical protein
MTSPVIPVARSVDSLFDIDCGPINQIRQIALSIARDAACSLPELSNTCLQRAPVLRARLSMDENTMNAYQIYIS